MPEIERTDRADEAPPRRFEFQFTVEAPVERVAHFHSDPAALKTLTPPLARMQLHEAEPLGEGSISRFTLWAGPIPLHWTARHEDVGPLGFTDVQIEGPLAAWRHRHEFRARGADRTEVRESIEYRYPAGLRGGLARLLFSSVALRALFVYRRFRTRRECRRAG